MTDDIERGREITSSVLQDALAINNPDQRAVIAYIRHLERIEQAARRYCDEQFATCLDVDDCVVDEKSPGCVNCYKLRQALEGKGE